MNLELDEREQRFRDEVRAFLNDNLSAELAEGGRAATSVFCDPKYSLPWQRILHAKGWAAPTWPEAFGGPGWNEMQRYIFAEECALAGAPNLAPMGLRMVGPCIMHHGTPEQRAHYLPRILSGEDYWCQGYSEPGAGSDLAALRTRAVADGDDYVVTGSKIWTTHAHFANRMFALVRTNPDAKPQAGITFLLIDMPPRRNRLRTSSRLARVRAFHASRSVQVIGSGAKAGTSGREASAACSPASVFPSAARSSASRHAAGSSGPPLVSVPARRRT